MGNLLNDILGNLKTRIMFIIYLSIIGITAFFIIFGYYNQLGLYEEGEKKHLQGIVTSLALQIDGDKHAELLEKYIWRDDITDPNQDPLYGDLHQILKSTQNLNNLHSPIYTLYYDDEEKVFQFIVSSDVGVGYRHKYEMYPEILLENMEEGAVLDCYETENGEWLSAFHPFFDSEGNLSGIVQADIDFSQFKSKAFQMYLYEAMAAMVVILVLALVLIPFVRKILKEEQKAKYELLYQKQLVEAKNRDLNDSVNYASKIQEAMLPETELITDLLPNSFVFYKPRDVVSGDFYWFKQDHLKNVIYIACADCTGHGIPGALMSMIGHSKLNAIVENNPEWSTDKILDRLDKAVTLSLTNKKYKTESKDGMDLGICKIDLNSLEMEFSGAFLNLVQIRNGEIIEHKGNRFPIGGGAAYQKTEFKNIPISIEQGDNFYMYSDGFPDQFGGVKEKKYLNKNFKKFLTTLSQDDSKTKISKLDQEFIRWQGELEQIDDVLVMGLSF